MNTAQQLSKSYKTFIYEKNWTYVWFDKVLEDISWEEATTQYANLNTICKLVYHINYYVEGQIKVLEGGPLEIKDKYSFDHPPVTNEEEWQALLQHVRDTADKYCAIIEGLPEAMFWEDFVDAQYGNWYRNLQGTIEHAHYHLGQIVLIKKLLRGQEGN